MPSTRNLVLIATSAFCIGALGVVATKRVLVDPEAPANQQRPTAQPRAERQESVWEKAALEQAAHDEAQRLQTLQRAARDLAEREQAELERSAEQKTEAQQDVLNRIALDRTARIESALAGSAISGARQRANENSAIATLRSIASAQAQCQAGAAIDININGAGEYAFLAEMAGTIPMRQFAAAGPILGNRELNPPVLSTSMGKVQDGGSGHGAIERNGYWFKIFLPGANATGVAEAITGGGTGVMNDVDAELSEMLWCAYAWPTTAGTTGLRAFFINQSGDLLQHGNTESQYNGTDTVPAFSDAYAGDSMKSPAATGWTEVQ